MTELELSEALKRGDSEARRELYERFAPMLLSLCTRYVGSVYDAEDVMQDGFLLIFNVIDRFQYRNEGSLSAWIRRVMTNFTLSYLEKEKKLQFDDMEPYADVSDDEDVPTNLDIDTIHQLISELPPGYRTVLNLYLVEGWSHIEIAKHLNIKESTSASQYLRAKKLLKDKITRYIQDHAL